MWFLYAFLVKPLEKSVWGADWGSRFHFRGHFMKRMGLLIVLFAGFSAMNGYGWGIKQPSGLEERIGALESNLKTIQNDKALENRVTRLENERSNNTPAQSRPVQTETVPAGGLLSVPINWAIILDHKENLGNLDYFVSKDISRTIPGYVNNSLRVRDRILEEITDERRSEEKLEISINDPGKLMKFSETPTDRESLEIFFSAQSAILTFTRNRNKNVFELTSVSKDGRDIDFHDETIQLCIKYRGRPEGILGLPEGRSLIGTAGAAETGSQQRASAQTARSGSPAIPERILLERGQGYLTKDAVVSFMQRNNNIRSSWFNRRNDDISALVNAYFELAKEEGVNHEIALAQMWHATQALSNNVLLRNCNYAGLSAVRGGTFKGRFYNTNEGVRAHIQHLKGYASTVRPRNLVDPRYGILETNGYLGKGRTLAELSVYWSPQDREYEENINRILRELYQYQYQYNSRR
jgi:hypothetical protein